MIETTVPIYDERAAMWGRFDRDREDLFCQFIDPPYDPATGSDPRILAEAVDAFAAAHPDLPKILVKAHSFRIVAESCRLHVDPKAWFLGDFQHDGILWKQRAAWIAERERDDLSEEARWFDLTFRTGALRGKLDFHHLAPGWENLFREGMTGIIAAARERLADPDILSDPRKTAFLRAVEITHSAACALARRFAEHARAVATRFPEYGSRLDRAADILEAAPAGPPAGFHEALQAIWFFQVLVEFEGESTMSLGHFDRMLYPHYRRDLDSGRLTRAEAKELLKYFWFKFHARRQGTGDSARNFTLAGQTRNGEDASNELTYLALEAFEELGTPDPKLSIRFFPGTPDRLYRRVAELVRKGCNSIVVMNDGPSIEGLVRSGKSVEDARTYLSIGCYEPAVDGKDMACTMNIPVNLAKGIELALNDGMDPLSGERLGIRTGDPRRFTSIGRVRDAYAAQMDHLMNRAAEYLTRYEAFWEEMNPSPFIAATIDDCVAEGRDIGEGGCRYNSVGCPAGALAETADSLAAIERAVFRERICTMDTLIAALAADFQGYEQLRAYLVNRVPKWGNGDAEVDGIARDIADHFCDTVGSFRTSRGGPYQPGLFALHFQWTFGSRTGALPCGRRSRTPTAPGIGAGPGMDRGGITSLMTSMSRLDFAKAPDGSVLDVMLTPDSLRGETGIETAVSLIRTHFERGGNYLQFNVVDTDVLEEAQQDPERFANLQIRVTGYSAYFTRLSKLEQDLFIARNKHAV